MENTIYELSLAGLLHDIGKLGQRSFEYKGGLSQNSLDLEGAICVVAGDKPTLHLHTLYTCEFIDRLWDSFPSDLIRNVRDYAIYHHRPVSEMQRIISEADKLSASRGIKEAESNVSFYKGRLSPVLESILDEGKEKKLSSFRHKLLPLRDTAEVIFPERPDASINVMEDFRRLWEGLIIEWRSSQSTVPYDYINQSLAILERYTWCVSRDAEIGTDVSLFDHLRMTSALAVCLYASTDEERPFIIVYGDSCGLNDNIGNGKNSFSDTVARDILKNCSCPFTHKIMDAGGHFYLLLPNNSKTVEVLKATKGEIDREQFARFKGEYSFNLGWAEVSRDEIRHFPQALRKVELELDRQKESYFSGVLITTGWVEDRFVFESDDANICQPEAFSSEETIKKVKGEALAYLRANVDNLGYIFLRGFSESEASISRVGNFSRVLDYFFRVYLQEHVKSNYPNVLLKGGNDIQAVGPWNDVFAFSMDMRDKFKEYVCGNKGLSLSAGIALSSASKPASSGLAAADAQLMLSKARRIGDKLVKEGFSAFGETMSWAEAKRGVDRGNAVIRWLHEGVVKEKQLRKLFVYAQMWREYKNSNSRDTIPLLYIPQLIDDLRREWGEGTAEAREAKQWARSLQHPDKEEIKQLYFISQYALHGVRTEMEQDYE